MIERGVGDDRSGTRIRTTMPRRPPTASARYRATETLHPLHFYHRTDVRELLRDINLRLPSLVVVT